MRDQLLINDIHLGVQRVAGTTPASALALQDYLFARLEALLARHEDKHVIFNGDLFDAFLVSMMTMLGFYRLAREWLKRTSEIDDMTGQECGRKMTLGRGNHDWSKDSSKLSSFDLICQILKAEFGDRVVVVTEPRFVAQDIYMIPHMPNQDLFNLELERAGRIAEDDVFKGEGGVLLLHANYDNNFALESDHSLNVSREQAEKLITKGWTLVFGHEHQKREPIPGVIITGNQWPSSVADCLNNPGDKKYAHVIKAGVQREAMFEPVLTWDGDVDFDEVDWQDLAAGPAERHVRFVRVTGKASAAEAPAMLQALANFRRASDAYVVSNAVQVEGLGGMEEITTSVEQMRAFNVMGYLLEQLEPKQREVVEGLLKQAAQEQQMEAA
jgi:hypothetical protein